MQNKNKKDTLSSTYNVEVTDIATTSQVNVNYKISPTQQIQKIWANTPKILIAILLLEVIAVYGLLFFVSPSSATFATQSSQESIEITASDTLIALTNQEREKYNLPHLSFNAELTKAAQTKAQYILDNNSFSHEGKNGETFSTWIRETNYQYKRVGENLAIQFDQPKDIMNAWMDSPLHRKNILNPLYQDIGIAVVQGNYKNKPTTIVVQLFGTQK